MRRVHLYLFMNVAPLRILVVEDNPGDARLIEYLLSQRPSEPVTVVRAMSVDIAERLIAAEALGRALASQSRVADFQEFDLVLLDMGLPGIEPERVVGWMLKLAPWLPIVVLSGRTDETVALQAVRDGAQDYLVKGRIDAEVLIRSIRYALERKRAQAALKESENRFASFMSHSPAIAFMKDASGRYLYANQLFERTLGLSGGEWLNRTDEELLPGQAAQSLKANDAAVLVGGRSIETHESVPGVDGPRDWLTFKFPFTSTSGVRHLAGMALDITQRVRAEEALRQAEAARLEAVQLQSDTLNALPAQVALVDGDAEVVIANESWRRAMPPGAVSSVNHADPLADHSNYLEWAQRLFAPPDAAKVRAGVLSVLRGEQARYSNECQLLQRAEQPPSPTGQNITSPDRGSGLLPQRRWCSILVTSLSTRMKRHAVVMHIDATDRRTTEDLLAQSQKRYQRVVETAHEAIWLTNVQGVATLVNRRVGELLGYRPNDLLGRRLDEFVQGEGVNVDRQRLDAAKRGRPSRYELQLRHRDGSTIWVQLSTSGMFNERGEYEGSLKMITDVTERKRAEQALREAEDQLRFAQKMEAVGQLAGGVAHDFNNLLTAIRGFASLARKSLSENHPAIESLNQVEEASRQAAGVAGALQTFARKKNAERLTFRVAPVVEEASRLFRRTLGPRVRFSADFAGAEGLWICGDESQLYQVIANLALNARDAVGDEGDIHISLRHTIDNVNAQAQTVPPAASAMRPDALATAVSPERGAGWAQICVRDSGVGMTPQVRSRIFEPFFTTKPRGQGTGLGLPVIHGIVLEHHGFIDVETTPGQGSTFCVNLPCVLVPMPLAPPASAGSLLFASLPALIVQISPMVRGVVASMLAALQFEVIHASSMSEAVTLTGPNGRRIGLLVCDQLLSDGNGLALFAALSTSAPALVCVIIGDAPDAAEVNQAISYLRKPFRVADLELCLHQLRPQAAVGA